MTDKELAPKGDMVLNKEELIGFLHKIKKGSPTPFQFSSVVEPIEDYVSTLAVGHEVGFYMGNRIIYG